MGVAIVKDSLGEWYTVSTRVKGFDSVNYFKANLSALTFDYIFHELFTQAERDTGTPIVVDIPIWVEVDIPDRFQEFGIRDLGLGLFTLYFDERKYIVNQIDLKHNTGHLKKILSQLFA